MAIVGEAHIIVRALTNKVDGDIKRGFSGINSSVARKAGESMGSAFTRGFNKNSNSNVFSRLASGLKALSPEAEKTRKHFAHLVKAGYLAQTALSTVLGGVFSLIGGLGALIGSAGGAASSLVVVGNAGFAMMAGMISAKLALSGVAKALAALNKQGKGAADNTDQIQSAEERLAQVIETNRENLIDANNAVRDAQLALNEAIKAGQEEIQQLGFDAEDAALSESKAALELERAREALARVQDLPPNSRARKEAELAYQEAELNLRKAKDKSADLNKEQDRLARTGVAGTEAVIKASARLAEAEASKAKTIRDGLRQQADAERALEKAKKGNDSGGTDPYAGLNQFQIDFVNFLQGLKPKLDELKLAVSGAFLPSLQEAITTLVNGLFPTVLTGMTQIATSMGVAVKSIANVMVEARNVGNLGSLFETSSRLIESFGRIIGNVYSSMLSILVAAAPLTQRFANHLENVTEQFSAFTDGAQKDGSMEAFFGRAGDAAAKFGKVFGNIFAGIGGMINANLGPGTGGDYLLTWLIDATQKFRDLGKAGEDGISPMSTYFKDAAVNAQKILSAIGALLGELVTLGANKAIGQTFDILATGADEIGKIVKAGIEAGPALASLVVVLVRIAAALADSSQPIAYFNALRAVAEPIAKFFEGPFFQAVMNAISPFLGIAGAIGTLGTAAAIGIKIVIGYVSLLSGTLGKLFSFIAANPIIAIVIAIAAAMIYLYKTNEQFAASVNQMFAQIGTAFGELAATVMPMFQALITSLMPVLNTLGTAIVSMLTSLVPLIGTIISALAPIIGSVINVIVQVVAALAPMITTIITALVPVFTMLVGVITQVVGAIAPLIPQLISSLLPAILSIVTGLLPFVDMLASLVIPLLGELLGSFILLAGSLLEAVIPIIVLLFEAFGPLIQTIMESVIPTVMILIATFIPLVKSIAETVIPIVIRLIEALLPLIMTIIEQLVPVVLTLVDTFLPLVMLLADLLIPIIMLVIEAFGPLLDMILPPLIALIELLMPVIKLLADLLIGPLSVGIMMVSGIIQLLTGNFEGFGRTFERIFTSIRDFGRKVVNDIIGIFEGMINFVIDGMNRMIDFINSIKVEVPGWVKDLLGMDSTTFGFNMPNIGKVSIPRLADGGIVSPSIGGTLAQIAEAGRPERVEPLDANGMSKRDKYIVDLIKAQQTNAGTINITVNPAPGMDERELAAAVSREISFQMRRGAVA